MATSELLTEQTVPAIANTFRHSATISKLAEALAKASAKFGAVKKAADNPFFKSKYADLSELIEATRKPLAENGLSVIQFPGRIVESPAGWRVELTTMLIHSSGEWLRGESEMPCAKRDAQGLGSAETYARRYAYQGILSLAGEQDDDGNAASGKKEPMTEEEGTQYEKDFDQRTQDQQCLKLFEVQAIDEAIKRTGKTEDETIAYLGLIGHKRIEHVYRDQFKEFLRWANSAPKAAKPNGKEVAAAILDKPKVDARTQAMKRLFGVANEFHIPEDDVKKASYEKFHVDSMTKLTIPQLDEMAEWVKEVAQTV